MGLICKHPNCRSEFRPLSLLQSGFLMITQVRKEEKGVLNARVNGQNMLQRVRLLKGLKRKDSTFIKLKCNYHSASTLDGEE